MSKVEKPKSDKRSAQDFIKKGRTARTTTAPVSGKPKSGNPFINR